MLGRKQAALGFIFVTLLIGVTGFGMIIPVIPPLIQELIHGTISDASRVMRLVVVHFLRDAILF